MFIIYKEKDMAKGNFSDGVTTTTVPGKTAVSLGHPASIQRPTGGGPGFPGGEKNHTVAFEYAPIHQSTGPGGVVSRHISHLTSTSNGTAKSPRNGLHRTSTDVTADARKVLDEFLAKRSGSGKTSEFVRLTDPLPTSSSSSSYHYRGRKGRDSVNGVVVIPRGGVSEAPSADILSPLSDEDEPEESGGKRKLSHPVSNVLDGDSSPSPVDERIPDEISLRKKKPFFVRARERLRESMRRSQEKKPKGTAVAAEEERPIYEGAGAQAETPTPTTSKKKSWTSFLRSRTSRKKKKKKQEEEEQEREKSELLRKKDNEKKSGKRHLSSTDGAGNYSERGTDDVVGLLPRSHSADETSAATRIRPVTSEESERLLHRYFSNSLGQRNATTPSTSSPTTVIGGSSSSAAPRQQLIAADPGRRVSGSKRPGHYSVRQNLHLEGLTVYYQSHPPTPHPGAPLLPAPRPSRDQGRHGLGLVAYAASDELPVRPPKKAPLAIQEDLTAEELSADDTIDGPSPVFRKPFAGPPPAALDGSRLGAGPGAAGVGGAVHDLEADGVDSWQRRPLLHATSKAFEDKSDNERNELFERIAGQLDHIADHYWFGPAPSNNNNSSKEEFFTAAPVNGAEEFDLRRTASSSSLASVAYGLQDAARNLTYDSFQRVVNQTIGSEPGIEQIAAMFCITRNAVHLVGIGTGAAGSIREMAIRYFSDHFAGWIDRRGGWESAVEDGAPVAGVINESSPTDMELD